MVHAFLQFCDPSLETVIQNLADSGVDEMVIFPFFISAGSHVQTDIPRAVETARHRHPGVRFHITRHLGILDAVEISFYKKWPDNFMTQADILIIKTGDTFDDLIRSFGNFEDWIRQGLGADEIRSGRSMPRHSMRYRNPAPLAGW